MVLTAEECQCIRESWAKLGPHMDKIGGEALCRLFHCYPKTKTYFAHFDLSPGSKDVVRHGQKVVKALDDCITHLDNIRGTLSHLSDLHAYNLRVDPVNFKLLNKCFLVAIATHLGCDFTPNVHLAFDKALHCIAEMLVEKYR